MLKSLGRIAQMGFEKSPKENLQKLQKKIKRTIWKEEIKAEAELNSVIPEIWEKPVFKKLISYRLRFSRQPFVFLGSARETEFLRSAFEDRGLDAASVEWDWDAEVNLDKFPSESQIIVCNMPLNDRNWMTIKRLKERFGSRVIGIQELVLPINTIQASQSAFNYWVKGLEQITPYYTGEQYFGPIDKLDEIFPLTGKTVIEFGPLDACQTAGLVRAGAKSVTAIEARAENFIKTTVARYALGLDNVNLIMDDLHNVDNVKYGKFDLAFAHGVYYHSVAPFLFFENLLSLADNVFMGGYCATDSSPVGEYRTLEYHNKKYRVKAYPEGDSYVSGVNSFGYFFHGDDLMEFFKDKNCGIKIITDSVEEGGTLAGKYLRFVATKKS